MISALIDQLGLELRDVLDRNILYDESKTYNVFHVPEVKNSPLVPAQEGFVVPENIKSVLGFGGVLPSGKLFVSILFSRVKISREIANMFRPLALSVKSALLPYEQRVFSTEK